MPVFFSLVYQQDPLKVRKISHFPTWQLHFCFLSSVFHHFYDSIFIEHHRLVIQRSLVLKSLKEIKIPILQFMGKRSPRMRKTVILYGPNLDALSLISNLLQLVISSKMREKNSKVFWKFCLKLQISISGFLTHAKAFCLFFPLYNT